MLYQIGTVTCEVYPFNVDTVTRETGADFAAKDVMGNLRPREFMGEGDESMTLVGRLLPETFGGLSTLEELQKLLASGTPQIVMRGDGKNLGWFLVERVRERHTVLAADGVGRQIDFSADLVRAKKPRVVSYLSTLLRLFAP